MLIISFAWTTPALLALRKTCTRRDWNRDYALRFHEGARCQGYDKGPRIGGEPIAIVKLTADPYQQRTSQAPDSDYEAEGLAWMEEEGLTIRGKHPLKFWLDWKAADQMVWVVRFLLIEIISREVIYGSGKSKDQGI